MTSPSRQKSLARQQQAQVAIYEGRDAEAARWGRVDGSFRQVTQRGWLAGFIYEWVSWARRRLPAPDIYYPSGPPLRLATGVR